MRTLTSLAALAIAPLVLVSTPAHAATGAATVSFVGIAHLPQFPCPQSCPGTFDATVAAGPIAKDLGVGAITGLHAEFTYTETCINGQALTGTAAGTATLTGDNFVGNPLPVDVPFTWTRVGAKALITWTGDPYVLGSATFGPTGGVPSCTGGELDAVVAGGAVILWV